jgi:pilus assembly protein Flp/PilA
MKALLTRLVREEQGQDVIEYALLAAAISVVAIPTIPSIGSAVHNVYTDINSKVGSLPGASS